MNQFSAKICYQQNSGGRVCYLTPADKSEENATR